MQPVHGYLWAWEAGRVKPPLQFLRQASRKLTPPHTMEGTILCEAKPDPKRPTRHLDKARNIAVNKHSCAIENKDGAIASPIKGHLSMTTRLKDINPDLCAQLKQASTAQQRAAARAACRFALDHTDLVGPIIDAGLEAMEAATYGDSRPRKQLKAFVSQLDNIQSKMRDCVENGLAAQANYIAAFRRARAANSIYFALGEDAYLAAAESVYEANAATSDPEGLVWVISSALHGYTF